MWEKHVPYFFAYPVTIQQMKGIPGNVSDPLAFYADPDPVNIINDEPDPARGKIFKIFYRYSVAIKLQGPGTATNKCSN